MASQEGRKKDDVQSLSPHYEKGCDDDGDDSGLESDLWPFAQRLPVN